MIVTDDLSQFGYRELDIAKDLLKAYADGKFKRNDFFSDGTKVMFNCNSGYVFLTDNDLNVGMLNDKEEIEQFFSCSTCGWEEFIEEFEEQECEECKKLYKENK